MTTLIDLHAVKDTGLATRRHGQTPYSGLQIIHAGLYRTGTKSMSLAYRELGYTAHHALDDVLGNPWTQLEHAAEATWPGVLDSPPRPKFTREDWDQIWAPFDVSTDFGCFFVPELIKAYPEAKIVIVKRDPDKWWESFRSELLDTLWNPYAGALNWFTWNVLRSRAPFAMMKLHCGFFGVKERAEIDAVAKKRYEEYYQYVLREVPKNRRLVYELGSGWEPLCQFLDKPVPNQPFPRVNDRAEHSKVRMQTLLKGLSSPFLWTFIGGTIVGVGFYMYLVQH